MYGEATEDEINIREVEQKEELTQENPVEIKQDKNIDEYKKLIEDMKK